MAGLSLTGHAFGWLHRDCGVVGCLSFVVCVDGVCCSDVVETSYEGHMVDALASRADEGRWSLDKPWGVGNQAVIRGCPNGETQHESCRVTRI